MKILIANRIEMPNKYIRYLKWKLYQIKKKFKNLLYAKVYLSQLNNKKQKFKATVKLGVVGNDIVITHREESLGMLWNKTFKDIHRYLNRHKRKNIRYINS